MHCTCKPLLRLALYLKTRLSREIRKKWTISIISATIQRLRKGDYLRC